MTKKEPLLPEEETPKHKRKKKRKKYAIEKRYVGKMQSWFWERKWHTYWSKYETEKDRDEALVNLQKKSANGSFWDREFEYRAKK